MVGGHETAKPMEVAPRMKVLLSEYEAKTAAMMNDIIHLFQDGNGRVGRLIVFKERLRFGIIPFIIEDAKKCIITGDSLNGNGRKTI